MSIFFFIFGFQDSNSNPLMNNRIKVSNLPPVEIWKNITVKELADALGKPISKLFWK